MGIFSFLRGADINQGIEEWKKTSNGVLVDVRTSDEYDQGHIPNAVNIPLQEIKRLSDRITDKTTPIYTYCLSGARSMQAASFIKRMGYTNVINIGGISAYNGKVVR